MNNPTFPEIAKVSEILPSTDSINKSRQDAEAFVRNNPVPSILGGLAIGFGLALILTRHRPSTRERYMSDPLGEIRGLLENVGHRANDSAKRGYDEGVSGIGRAVKSIRQHLNMF